jgi:hypothetical protein
VLQNQRERERERVRERRAFVVELMAATTTNEAEGKPIRCKGTSRAQCVVFLLYVLQF